MTTHFPNMSNGANGSTPPQQQPAQPVHQAPPPLPPGAPWQFKHLLRFPNDPIVRQRFEFRDLALKIREHLTNQVGQYTRDKAARMLWVQGKPGEGKSDGCLIACLNANFTTAVLSPGLFAGEVEGASVQTLHAVMAELERWSATYNVRVVVIIDDFDLSTANVGENQGHTINSQLLVNEFMALADKRHLYRNVDGSNIGFIITVNDATGMRESLHRPGRAIWYDHMPSPEDRTNIAWSVLDPKTSTERALVTALVRKNIRQPIAFWTALQLHMRALQARSLIEKGMPEASAINAVYQRRLALTPETAWAAAKLIRTSRVRNYLTNRKRWWGRR
ncbi:MAG: hypothetical protein H6876_06315 [Hyphomicrobiaceae bacterium]|nr:hypothetical protein [Hyphomicrobiaceae bacterium]